MGMPVWFGANAPAQEQAEQSHLNTKEGGGLARRQDHQQHGEVSAEASNEECRLGRSVPQRLSAHDRLDARHVQREPLQHQEREEEIALPPGQPTGETAPALRCRRCERERTGSQVGVCALLVRVGVVTVVLSQPPAIAQPGEEPRDHPRGPFVPAVRGEDLVVCGIVSQEAELGEHDRQRRGEHELEPRVAKEHEDNPDRDERRNQSDDLEPVVGIAPLEQA
jgi:hypothetical protein